MPVAGATGRTLSYCRVTTAAPHSGVTSVAGSGQRYSRPVYAKVVVAAAAARLPSATCWQWAAWAVTRCVQCGLGRRGPQQERVFYRVGTVMTAMRMKRLPRASVGGTATTTAAPPSPPVCAGRRHSDYDVRAFLPPSASARHSSLQYHLPLGCTRGGQTRRRVR